MKGYVKIFTYGCQMNDLDSQKMYSILSREGWEPTESLKEADLIILNTCSVRQKAYEKALSNIGRLRPYKKRKPSLIIAVTGCIAQQKGSDIISRMPHVDIVLGTHQLHRICTAVEEKREENGPVVDTRFGECIPSLKIVPHQAFMVPTHRAYINIMQGCNNYCSYCIVPYVRGREISRDHFGIVEEARRHADSGVREIFLLGQNVNSYSGGISFPELLRCINDIGGIERIRFTTSHPKDMSDDLIACFGSLEKLCNHIHLPFQSGSDRVLRLMNRQYTRETYLELIEKLRQARPDIAFSADVIVGFPGEDDEAYRQTLELIREVRFDLLYSFRYSIRPGTEAASLEDSVAPEEKSLRLRELQSVQRAITLEINRSRVGLTYPVLVDGVSVRNAEQVYGRTTQNTIVNFTGPHRLIGRIVDVRITRANPNSLTGETAEYEPGHTRLPIQV
ncbi:MAG: (Dimethylallyl)adenosine tRNA methylthiotransferase MiaB [Deltaproteobacteria bacterium ADurb.BinA179]|jgi:tRNA-2-methylthio-N6-dimethylallyladenosine synthase|nr:tRNA (N6-isopentenyl adenosine(37)-C2)-methylthiotransferase MiaB [Deltaproteobacteria bacterium]MDI9543620.1 tRNA (N6-isopentenyl adenosine(37)-C2)-methylthiotransferase MiaB [Pseudomonadota bacterium]OPZ29599.1 MAG: (Dimethylallyl)adenosine tRNA methylthiotransferase MiaB [Deltaproteobacteria bacterium ADurb.BinA179]HNR50699.1 tRNA (N6-isopentenyl adenosine(37)-C2)-methylthiotransferase MiaB [Deltaproteobacteria bacterium]HOD70896.1 tRNA (N6-isopentenyl adenosine(37)-C2)-methylthiotransfer